MLEFFPEKDRVIVQRLLRNGICIEDPNEEYGDVIEFLSAWKIINSKEKEFVKCSNLNDEDFAERVDLNCLGIIIVDKDDLYCPECGRPIEKLSAKEKYLQVVVHLNPVGIRNYIKCCIESIENVTALDEIEPFVFKVTRSNGRIFSIVITMYGDVCSLSRGLFFSEPTLYILPSHIEQEDRTILEDQQYMELTDFISETRDEIIKRITIAATPIDGRLNYEEIESQFDDMLERHQKRRWQFFEQEFIPALTNYLSQNPAKVQAYLEKLQRVDQTVFGEFHVPIGGAGQTDLMPVNKFSMMNQLISGNKIGDAKCHTEASLDYSDISTINLHLDRDRDNDVAVVYVANDDIRPNAWRAILDLRTDGKWKIIILQKYLLLELISEIDATHLLEL